MFELKEFSAVSKTDLERVTCWVGESQSLVACFKPSTEIAETSIHAAGNVLTIFAKSLMIKPLPDNLLTRDFYFAIHPKDNNQPMQRQGAIGYVHVSIPVGTGKPEANCFFENDFMFSKTEDAASEELQKQAEDSKKRAIEELKTQAIWLGSQRYQKIKTLQAEASNVAVSTRQPG